MPRPYTDLINPHRAKVDIHLASVFRGAQCFIPLLPISLSFRSLPSGIGSTVIFFSWAVDSNPLVALHLLVVSFGLLLFGHGHTHTDTLAASYPRLTSGSPPSGDIHTSRTGGSVSTSFFSPLNVSLPRLNTASSCFRNIALAFSYYLGPDSHGFV